LQLPEDSSIEGLMIAAGMYAEKRGVLYCDISLRPVALQQAGGAGRMLQPYVEVGGKNYMQTAVNVWKRDVQTPLPPSDGVFE
jgi:hypothetical protein